MQKYEKSLKRGEIYFYDSKDYEKEKKDNTELLISLNDEFQRERDGKAMKERFMDTVSYYIDVRELTPLVVSELIERIEVFHVEGTGNDKHQRIIIHCNFIGLCKLTGNGEESEGKQTQDKLRRYAAKHLRCKEKRSDFV